MWFDPWIHNGGNNFVISLIATGTENMLVSDLIDHTEHKWKPTIINMLFNDRDVQNITIMPINDEVNDDKHIWLFTPQADYSVCSAYRYIMETLVNNSDLRLEGNWRKLWQLKVPKKVKVFMWRVARGCLPTQCPLQTRGVQCSERCVMCERSYKNDLHVLFGFDGLEVVWEATNLWHISKENLKIVDSFVSLFFQLLKQLPQQQLLTFVMTWWCIWKRRNDKLYSAIDTSPHMFVQMARETLLQW